METINQKEYLKKYLSRGKELGKKKKKKKKCTGISDRVKIIDDDLVAETFNQAVEEDLQTNEDAPQIVGVIDDRPMALRIDDFRKSDKWKPLGATEAYDILAEQVSKSNILMKRKKSTHDDDYSPSRRIKNEGRESISEYEQKTNDDISPPRQRRRDSDASPPRKQKYDEVISSHRSKNDDTSPPRRKKRNSNFSPPRRSRTRDSSQRSFDRNGGQSHTSSPRNKKSEDFQQMRKNKRRDNSDHSPGRKRSDTETNQHHFNKEDVEIEVDHRGKHNAKIMNRYNSRWAQIDDDSNPPCSSNDIEEVKIEPGVIKTLDGKTAGLRNAEELQRETRVFKNREDELFENMSAETLGVNAKAVLRDRKTGKIRDLKKEAEEAKKKKEKENEHKEKYDRWGKGLKQVEAYDEKLKQDLHEMNKPLARYADDVDLERHLKEQEREGDPMLAYIRKKKKVKEIVAGKPIKPQFEGEFMPNRYAIRPGHRWDGVDRSNGYEKKYFEVINSRKAQQEDVYKWSTEDM